ncbi:MAG: hypothetical protein AAGE18_03240 [Pseudomonadota bacterium]
MLGLALVDVAIGLIFILLLLSLIATAVQEMLAALLQMRGKTLKNAVAMLMEGDATLVDRLYEHPLIRTLQTRSSIVGSSGRRLPSYIPPQTFARALVETVAAGRSGLRTAIEAGTARAVDIIGEIEDMGAASRNLGTDGARLADTLRAVVSRAAAKQDALVDEVEERIAAWYDNAMDRVQGWYKRRTNYTLFCIGLVVAVLMNADAIGSVSHLSANATARQQMALLAETYAQDRETLEPSETAAEAYEQALADLSAAPLPLGWDPVFDTFEAAEPGACTGGLRPLACVADHVRAEPLVIFGWLLTAVGVTLGAPFWFDLLQSVLKIRATGRKLATAHEEQGRTAQKNGQSSA